MDLITAFVDEPGNKGLTLSSEGATLQGVMADLAWQADFEVFDYWHVEDGVYRVQNCETNQSFKAIVEGV